MSGSISGQAYDCRSARFTVVAAAAARREDGRSSFIVADLWTWFIDAGQRWILQSKGHERRILHRCSRGMSQSTRLKESKDGRASVTTRERGCDSQTYYSLLRPLKCPNVLSLPNFFSLSSQRASPQWLPTINEFLVFSLRRFRISTNLISLPNSEYQDQSLKNVYLYFQTRVSKQWQKKLFLIKDD